MPAAMYVYPAATPGMTALRFVSLFTESLILAQDERWRHA